MTPTVRPTKTGKGAMVIVRESDEAVAERQKRRRAKAASDAGQLQFTPGQIAMLRKRKSSRT